MLIFCPEISDPDTSTASLSTVPFTIFQTKISTRFLSYAPTTGSPPATASATASNAVGQSTTLNVAVGLPLGLVSFAIFIFLLVLFRRRMRPSTDSTPQPNTTDRSNKDVYKKVELDTWANTITELLAKDNPGELPEESKDKPSELLRDSATNELMHSQSEHRIKEVALPSFRRLSMLTGLSHRPSIRLQTARWQLEWRPWLWVCDLSADSIMIPRMMRVIIIRMENNADL